MSIELVMPSNYLVLCLPLLLLPSLFPSIRVFSNELALHIRWPKYWSYASLYMLAHHLSTLFSTFKLHHCSYYSRGSSPFLRHHEISFLLHFGFVYIIPGALNSVVH